MNVLYVTNIPSPYRVDYFNKLGQYCELTVIFETGESLERDDSWKQYEFENFQAFFCKGIRVRTDGILTISPIKYLRKWEYDWIIICNAISLTGLLETLYMRIKRIPYWIEGDGAFVPEYENKLKKLLKKIMLSGAQGYFSTCKNHDQYYMHYGVDQALIYRYPFSSVKERDIIRTPKSWEEKANLRKKLCMPEEQVVITVGQFIHRKGLDVLLEACKKISCDVGFYFVGGEALPVAENMKNIHIIPFLPWDKLKEYYDAADVLVCPTREDIWGLVINEAMSRGLPVITTTKCNAGLELVEDGQNGFLIEPDHVDMLVDRIDRVLEADLTGKMRKLSLEKAKSYTIEAMVNRHMEIANRKKALIVTQYYFPGYRGGGPVQTVYNVTQAFGDSTEFYILTSDHDLGSLKKYRDISKGWNIVGAAKVKYLSKLRKSIMTISRYASGMDIVYACGLFEKLTIKALLAKRFNLFSGELVVAPQGVFFEGAFSQKKWKKALFIKLAKSVSLFKNVTWSFTSKEELATAEKHVGAIRKYVLAEDIPRQPMKVDRCSSGQGALRVVFLSRICPQKNLKQCIEILENVHSNNIIFDIYGTMENKEYYAQCEKLFQRLGTKVRVAYCGEVKSEEVQKVFSKYDVFLFPTLGENYGHVVFEALSAGCIPVISDMTPWHELKNKNCGVEIALSDIQTFTDTIDKYAVMTRRELETCAYAAMLYAEEKYKETLLHSGFRSIFSE